MTSPTNKYGLTRDIPAGVKRAVRRACGFGCVICGHAIIQYEHFNPPFAEAKEHNPEGMALLCGGCHDRKTRGFLSASTVAQARQNPMAFQRGYAHDLFDLRSPFILRIGNSSVERVSTIVRTREGENWFVINEPEEEGAPIRLSVLFFDQSECLSLNIQENEWRCFSGQWDTEAKGKTITVRRGIRDIVLELTAEPPHEIHLNRLAMQKGDLGIFVEQNGRFSLSREGGITTFDTNLINGADSVFVV